MSQYPKDIEAQVIFLNPEEGGRKGPIFSDYRTTFIYDDHFWDAVIHFEDRKYLPIGEPVRVYFAFLSPQAHVGKIYPGKEFQLWEGHVIGNGVVLIVIDLEKSAALAKKS